MFIVPVLFVVIPLFESKVNPEVLFNVPPLNIILSASVEPGLPLIFASEATLSVPADSVALPV